VGTSDKTSGHFWQEGKMARKMVANKTSSTQQVEYLEPAIDMGK
jgi:hypothetical protein